MFTAYLFVLSQMTTLSVFCWQWMMWLFLLTLILEQSNTTRILHQY